MKPPKEVKLLTAKYIKDYKFLFTFSNEKESFVDFYPIISHGTSLLKYLDVDRFKKICIDKQTSDIYWGENWDMCFRIHDYYNETEILPVKQKGGRKPVADKKATVRLYIPESIIASHGGLSMVQEKLTEYLTK